jgi:hypothetical protein
MNARDTRPNEWAQAIERIGAMPAFLDAAIHEAGDEYLGARPSRDEFSLTEHACHLRDLEREGYLLRVRRILSEDAPELEGFDGTAVAKSRDYPAQDPHAAARDFASARGELLALLATLEPGSFQREARFGGRRITLADLVTLIDAHDGEHRAEIERLLDDVEA